MNRSHLAPDLHDDRMTDTPDDLTADNLDQLAQRLAV